MYKIKAKDKVYKYFPKLKQYETQHKNTSELKVYTVSVANSNGVTLYNIPYILFDYNGEVLHIDHRKCPYMIVGNRTTGIKPLNTWSDAVIVPVSVYNEDYRATFFHPFEKDATDEWQEYEEKVYQL